MKFMPRSSASRIRRIASAFVSDGLPICDPPIPMQDTFCPVCVSAADSLGRRGRRCRRSQVELTKSLRCRRQGAPLFNNFAGPFRRTIFIAASLAM